MAKTAWFCLGVAVVLVLSNVFAPSCQAQDDNTYTYGTWYGVETVTTTTLNESYVPISVTTESFWTTMTIQLNGSPPIYAYFGSLMMPDAESAGPVSIAPYGTDGLTGYLFEDQYPAGYEFVYFDAIPGSYADATYTGSYSPFSSGETDYTLVNAYFETVPEPTAFAQAAIAIVSLSVFAYARRRSAG